MKKWIICPAAGKMTLLEKILSGRGIASADEFLNPRLGSLRDPFEIPNIEKAARRALLAKERGEKILVYGDYDVDGVTGTAILLHTLKFLGMDADYYIPHRYNEGYGLSLDSVKKIAETGANLIMTVDCGISSAIEVEAANALGMDVIVTDHHNLPQPLPAALAIVNPKQIAGDHPSKYLSGAGVAFKFAWALLRAAGEKNGSFLTSLLDLAALGTFSDVVPLTGENRVLAVFGLNLINERKRLGVGRLLEAAGIHGRLAPREIYFGLAPRINAAGRLEHASKAVELLLTDDPQEAKRLSEELCRINSRRQDIGSSIREEVFASLNQNDVNENKIILLSGSGWHPGVIGIVASKVAEAFYRPAVLIGVKNGVGRGSARSVDGVNIFDLLNSCRDLFLDFGGHAGAAGFEIKTENISELKRRLESEAGNRIKPEELIPKIEIDAEIDPAQINLKLVKELEKLAPFGEGNPAPVLAAFGLKLADYKTVGAGGKHLKAWFEKDGINLETIGFGMGEMKLSAGANFDIAFNLESNEWNGFEKVQLGLVDVRPAEAGREGLA